MPAASSPAQPSSPQKRRKRHFWRWIFLALLLSAIVWVAISANPFAQGLREIGGDKPDQSILNRTFSVSPRSFRYYQFTLPKGSSHVVLIGEFTAQFEKDKGPDGSESAARGIELLVLSESAFAIWQKGGSATSVYDSGRMSHAEVRAGLPDGAGVYYIVFSNKLSPSGASNVRAALQLHSKSWLPDWIRRLSKRAPVSLGILSVARRGQ
ncbi:MAG: hypothetical protein WCF26_00305 [Candidatus Sulfotelmatobacter sp.]